MAEGTEVVPSQVFRATLGARGAVRKGAPLTHAEAVAERRAGRDVVVCGPNINANRRRAKAIETEANGSCKMERPHLGAGRHSLPHFQPKPRPPEGHTFYETPNRRAF